MQQPDIICAYLMMECHLGRTVGPLAEPPLPRLQCSPLGAVPKKSSDKWCLILHLSYPEGSSINDGIPPDDFRLHYISVDTAIKHILALGHSCSLAKFDIKSTFRLVPVHPDDWELLGMQWNNSYYFDTVLPFGLRITPFLFNQIANGLEWTLKSHSIPVLLHYLDGFLIIAQTHDFCGAYLQLATTLCIRLGVPLVNDKTKGPATLLTFLRISIKLDILPWTYVSLRKSSPVWWL